MFAYRFYAVAKFSLGTAWARVSACLLLPVCLLLLLLRIYASCLRLFNQLFSLTRVRLARSRSLFNYSCTALTALANSLFFSLSLRFSQLFFTCYSVYRVTENFLSLKLCRCTRLRRLLQDHK